MSDSVDGTQYDVAVDFDFLDPSVLAHQERLEVSPLGN
jgi:hypothetical protein